MSTGFSRESAARFAQSLVEQGVPESSFLILRHGGRRTDKWRLVGAARTDETMIRGFYEKKSDALCAGAIALVRGGEVLEFGWAPWLRTRW